jgi:hypothetical protein
MPLSCVEMVTKLTPSSTLDAAIKGPVLKHLGAAIRGPYLPGRESSEEIKVADEELIVVVTAVDFHT